MIRVQNIYYMLAYAYQTLNSHDEKKYSSESFDFVDDLFAAILSNGLGKLLKQGLRREYIVHEETLTSPRGKICLSETMNLQAIHDNQVICQVDDYLENTYLNQILKATAILLLRSKNVKAENKKKLKRILLYFADVDTISHKSICWSSLHYNKTNHSYKMLMNICYLVIEGMLMSEADGKFKLNEFIDDQKMYALYEKFLLAYYRRHYPSITVSQSHIDWKTDDAVIDLLPQMKTDIMFDFQGCTFIIDAKYYKSSMQTGQYGNKTVYSNNMYQIFAYVKNRDINLDGSVSGMLLYVKTDEGELDKTYHLSGNKISVKTLDLDCDFSDVSAQLDHIIAIWLQENSLECKRVG